MVTNCQDGSDQAEVKGIRVAGGVRGGKVEQDHLGGVLQHRPSKLEGVGAKAGFEVTILFSGVSSDERQNRVDQEEEGRKREKGQSFRSLDFFFDFFNFFEEKKKIRLYDFEEGIFISCLNSE